MKKVLFAFDIGMDHTAICALSLDDNQEIIYLEKFSVRPDKTKYANPSDVVPYLFSHLDNLSKIFDQYHLVVAIEKQKIYLPQRSHIIQSINSVIETAIICFYELKNVMWESVCPKKVKKYFNLLSTAKLLSKSAKKKKAVLYVNGLIEEDKIRMSEASKYVFSSEKKKDDLADAILTALYYAKENNI